MPKSWSYFVQLAPTTSPRDAVGVYQGPVPEPGQVIEVIGRSNTLYTARVLEIDLERMVSIRAEVAA